MSEPRGVRKNSLKNIIKDPATKEAIRNVEARLLAIERRISIPLKVVRTVPGNSPFSVTSGGSNTTYIVSSYHANISTNGGLILGMLEPEQTTLQKITTPTADPQMYVEKAGVDTLESSIFFYKDDVVFKQIHHEVEATSATGIKLAIPPTANWFLDNPAEGSYLYYWGIHVPPNTDVFFQYIQFSLYELFPLR